MRKYFKCDFLSDIVLSAQTATEGSQQSLNYISGSCFLGIVAKAYGTFLPEDAYDVFHSGKVMFGDAHIACNGKRSLRQPASWFFEKGESQHEKIYLHHYITDAQRAEFSEQGTQLKQVRGGYFAENKAVAIAHDFSIKSAHNRSERRSQEGQLYGYDALRKGTQWIFYIESKNKTLLDAVAGHVSGEHNIGRSKTAQYGRVSIQEISDFEEDTSAQETSAEQGVHTIYFESCAAFLDECGNPTYQPTLEQLGFESGKIVWEKSQVLTKTFASWNGKRRVRDADKLCIDKGSVLVVEGGALKESMQGQALGIYCNEGFGRVLINPAFLHSANTDGTMPGISVPVDVSKDDELAKTVGDLSDDHLLKWVGVQKKQQCNARAVQKTVNDFIENNRHKFRHITPSQWGGIRERAQRFSSYPALHDELFGEKKGYLMHGKTESKWRSVHGLLEKEYASIKSTGSGSMARRFLVNLASEMAKKESEK